MKRVKKRCASPDCNDGKQRYGEPCTSCHGTGYVWTYETVKSVKQPEEILA